MTAKRALPRRYRVVPVFVGPFTEWSLEAFGGGRTSYGYGRLRVSRSVASKIARALNREKAAKVDHARSEARAHLIRKVMQIVDDAPAGLLTEERGYATKRFIRERVESLAAPPEKAP